MLLGASVLHITCRRLYFLVPSQYLGSIPVGLVSLYNLLLWVSPAYCLPLAIPDPRRHGGATAGSAFMPHRKQSSTALPSRFFT
jgi:hypothetical protein